MKKPFGKGLERCGTQQSSGSLLLRCVGQLPPKSVSQELQGPGKGAGGVGRSGGQSPWKVEKAKGLEEGVPGSKPEGSSNSSL